MNGSASASISPQRKPEATERSSADTERNAVDGTQRRHVGRLSCPIWAKGAFGYESNQEIGVSRGGKNTKIHAVVDALGNPVYLQLSASNLHDCSVAIDVPHVSIAGSMILADRGHDTNEILVYIEDQDGCHTIPSKTNRTYQRKCDWWLYKEHHLVECFFNKLKHFRRIATRYDKLAKSFIAFVLLASIMILVK